IGYRSSVARTLPAAQGTSGGRAACRGLWPSPRSRSLIPSKAPSDRFSPPPTARLAFLSAPLTGPFRLLLGAFHGVLNLLLGHSFLKLRQPSQLGLGKVKAVDRFGEAEVGVDARDHDARVKDLRSAIPVP